MSPSNAGAVFSAGPGVITAGSGPSMTLIITMMLSPAPEGSVAVSATMYMSFVSKSSFTFVLICPLLSTLKEAESSPLRV